MSPSRKSVSRSGRPLRNVNSPQRPRQHENDAALRSIADDLTATKPDPSDDKSLKMTGPFLGRLPREIRDTIYEYVLDFDEVPPLRTNDETIQKSFVHWSYTGQRFVERKICPAPPTIAATNLLNTNKTIRNEALQALYRVNTIALNLGQCKQIFGKREAVQQGTFSGDIATARHVLLRMGTAHGQWQSLRRANTIDLDSFLANIRTVFPALRSVTVRTDHAPHATNALFDIGVDLMSSDQVRNVKFDAVGSLVAETNQGFTLRVEHRRITRDWQRQMTESLRGWNLHPLSRAEAYCRMRRLLDAEKMNERLNHWGLHYLNRDRNTVDWQWKQFGNQIPEIYKACAVDSHEFWTYAVGNYVPFETYAVGNYMPFGSAYMYERSDADDGSYESDSSDVATALVGAGSAAMIRR